MRKDKTQAANDLKSQNHNTGKFPRTGGYSWSQMIDWIKKRKRKKLALQPEKELTLNSHYWKSREEGKDCHSGLGLPFM